RLVDLVRKTVADVGPPPARRTVRVIIVANNTDRLVVFAVTVDNHSSLPGHLPNQAHEIEVVASLDLRRPFKNEDSCIVRPDVERITERRFPVRRTIHHDFMAQRLSNLSVVVEILSASTIFVHVVDEYQTHKRGGLLRSEIEVVASLDLRRPFKNEDSCIVRPDVERITERRFPVRRTIHHDFMAQRLSNLSVVVEILSASTIFVHVVDEYQTHKRGGLL